MVSGTNFGVPLQARRLRLLRPTPEAGLGSRPPALPLFFYFFLPAGRHPQPQLLLADA